ncbi:hypothetical protein CsSME_00004832 [Camellia sinensis var. sinensis]
MGLRRLKYALLKEFGIKTAVGTGALRHTLLRGSLANEVSTLEGKDRVEPVTSSEVVFIIVALIVIEERRNKNLTK